MVTIEAPNPVAINTGSKLWINSEEVSMNIEASPMAQIPAGMATSVAGLKDDHPGLLRIAALIRFLSLLS
jgi:hypothetical protein